MMFQLGDELFDVKSLVRSHRKDIEKPVYTIEFQLGQKPSDLIYYHLFRGNRPIIQNSENLGQSVIAFLINNWDLEDYQFLYFEGNVIPLLLGNYAQDATDQESKQKRFIRAEEMAASAQGIDRVGYLRMDVDRLGQIFAKGLNKSYSLQRLAGLSRQMSYFFKVYLNSLAKQRSTNLPEDAQVLSRNAEAKPSDRPNLLFIYAGGDDLFVSGAWSEVIEFAFDIYQSFRAYTGHNSDITLSGGISIETEKFPLHQAAESAGSAEKAAKSGGRDGLGLFGEVFKWNHWLGNPFIDRQDQKYLSQEAIPQFLGVLPFVQQLVDPQQLAIGYSRNFIRNLLITAQIREQKIQEIQQSQPEQIQAVTYYLHLPKLAYAFSRLPQRVRDDPKFIPIRQSLMSPRNSPYFRAIATWIELLTRKSNT
jgi:CRISPR-associated protein Csm1